MAWLAIVSLDVARYIYCIWSKPETKNVARTLMCPHIAHLYDDLNVAHTLMYTHILDLNIARTLMCPCINGPQCSPYLNVPPHSLLLDLNVAHNNTFIRTPPNVARTLMYHHIAY